MTDATRTRTRLAREERREQIIDAAVDVFRDRDPASVTFEEIADAAGVSRALVYNYFGDRNGLLEAVYRRTADRLRDDVVRALTNTRGHRAALAAVVEAHLDFASADLAGYRYVAGGLPFTALPNLDEERVREAAATLGSGREAMLVARGLLAAIQSMVEWWLEHGSPPNRERAVEIITSFAYEGLSSTHHLGLPFTPTWRVPASADGRT